MNVHFKNLVEPLEILKGMPGLPGIFFYLHCYIISPSYPSVVGDSLVSIFSWPVDIDLNHGSDAHMGLCCMMSSGC